MLRFLPLLLLLLFPAGLALPGLAQPAPAVVTLPFEVVAGVIVLRHGQLNGQRGDFLLDTGCTEGLLVEQAAFASQLRPGGRQGLSAAGRVPLSEVPITQFALGALRTHPATARATSLATLQAAVGGHLLGILGTELLQQYEVVIDYAHRQLSLYPLGRGYSPARPFTRRDSVAFTLENGWPVVVAFFDSVPVQLLLDTGSQDNHLDADFAHDLPAISRPTGGRRAILVVPGGQLAGQRATLPALQVGARTWRGLPVVLAPPVRYPSGRALPYQGILGGTFLSQELLISFHYGRRQLYTLAPR